jgi:phospholipid/cholesterol/gamma-HCH transport system substrate-binding protein
MKRSIIETILGAVVLVVAGVFLAFGYRTANIGGASDGYEITADFSGIGGLAIGDDVQISGVKVGAITDVTLVPGSYLARVHINVDPKIKLPVDTAALISSESLLGGRYLALEPGADEEMIPAGGHVQYTQAPQNLEQLLGQFIFSMQQPDEEKTQ